MCSFLELLEYSLKMLILWGPCSEILLYESSVSDIISPHIRVWKWAVYSDPFIVQMRKQVFLQQGWERLELESQSFRGHGDKGLKTWFLISLVSWGSLSVDKGRGESGAGLNSDGFLTQHTVTCSEVRLLWGHRKDFLPVLNVQFEQHWMHFKMHFTPGHGSNTDFSYCMGEVWKETDMWALQTRDHAHKRFRISSIGNFEHLHKSRCPILMGPAVTHPKGAWWSPGAQTVNALRTMFLLVGCSSCSLWGSPFLVTGSHWWSKKALISAFPSVLSWQAVSFHSA